MCSAVAQPSICPTVSVGHDGSIAFEATHSAWLVEVLTSLPSGQASTIP